jgi:hypothetical protein
MPAMNIRRCFNLGTKIATQKWKYVKRLTETLAHSSRQSLLSDRHLYLAHRCNVFVSKEVPNDTFVHWGIYFFYIISYTLPTIDRSSRKRFDKSDHSSFPTRSHFTDFFVVPAHINHNINRLRSWVKRNFNGTN